jgi:lipopolysaccharide transport system permease protein
VSVVEPQVTRPEDAVLPSTATAPESSADDLPLTVIEPRSGWHVVDLGELWRFRELLYFLTWRDVAVRYKQTVLGVAWAFLQPVATMLVFVVFLGRAAGLSASVEHYALYVLTGVVPWTFFANAVTSSGNSLVANERLITRVYFPRLIIPLSCVGAAGFDFAISVLLIALLMVWYGVLPGLTLLAAPLLIVLLAATAAGVGIFLSALIVAQRDFRYILNFGVQLWMFATPAIYLPPDALGPNSRLLAALNPAQGLIFNLRASLLGGSLDLPALALSTAVALTVLAVGCLYFRAVERYFADII